MTRYLSAQQTADYLGITKDAVYRLARIGVLPAIKKLGPKTRRWDRNAIDHLMSGGGLSTGVSWDDAIGRKLNGKTVSNRPQEIG